MYVCMHVLIMIMQKCMYCMFACNVMYSSSMYVRFHLSCIKTISLCMYICTVKTKGISSFSVLHTVLLILVSIHATRICSERGRLWRRSS